MVAAEKSQLRCCFLRESPHGGPPLSAWRCPAFIFLGRTRLGSKVGSNWSVFFQPTIVRKLRQIKLKFNAVRIWPRFTGYCGRCFESADASSQWIGPNTPCGRASFTRYEPDCLTRKHPSQYAKSAKFSTSPFVKKSALIGTEDLVASFCDELKSFSRRELLIFKAREEALDWLAADLVDA